MLKAKTLKNLALTFGNERKVDATFSFMKYSFTVDAEHRIRWALECRNLEAAGMFKPDTDNNTCPDTYLCWHGYLGTKYERISVMMFSNEIAITYRTKSILDRM